MEHPHTHPTRPDQGRSETSPDVLSIAVQLRNMLSNEEVWYVLQTWKNKVIEDAKREANEANKADSSWDTYEPRQQPWGDIGGIAFSEREAAELPICCSKS